MNRTNCPRPRKPENSWSDNNELLVHAAFWFSVIASLIGFGLRYKQLFFLKSAIVVIATQIFGLSQKPCSWKSHKNLGERSAVFKVIQKVSSALFFFYFNKCSYLRFLLIPPRSDIYYIHKI